MDGIATAKVFYFSAVLTTSVFVVSVKLLFSSVLFSVRLNWLDVSVLCFWIHSALRLVFTPYASFTDESFIVFSAGILLYFLFKFFINEGSADFSGLERNLHLLTIAFLAGGFLQAIYGILQLYGLAPFPMANYFRLRGSFGNPDAYSGYLVSVMPFAFGLHFLLPPQAQEYRHLRYFGTATLLAGLAVLPATMIRSSWLAVIAGVTVICLRRYEIREKIKQYIRSKVFLFVGAFSGVLITISATAGLYALKPDSAGGRLLIWKITSNMIKESPLFGIGFDRYRVQYGNVQAAFFVSGKGTPFEEQHADNVSHAHNEYLQVLTEGGVVGFIFVASSLLLAVGAFHRVRFKAYEDDHNNPRNVLLVAARASLVAILISSLFSFPVHILPTAINLIFLLSLISYVGGYKNAVEFGLQPKRLKQLGLVGMAIGLLVLVPLMSSYRAYEQWNRAFGKALTMDFEDALIEYDLLRNHFNEEGKFLFMHGAMLAQVDRHDEAIKVLEEAKKRFNDLNLWVALGQSYEAAGDYSSAERHYVHASNMIPHKLYPRYLLAKLYQKTGKNEDAIRVAQAILRAEEKVQTTAAGEMKFEMKQFLQSARIP